MISSQEPGSAAEGYVPIGEVEVPRLSTCVGEE